MRGCPKIEPPPCIPQNTVVLTMGSPEGIIPGTPYKGMDCTIESPQMSRNSPKRTLRRGFRSLNSRGIVKSMAATLGQVVVASITVGIPGRSE